MMNTCPLRPLIPVFKIHHFSYKIHHFFIQTPSFSTQSPSFSIQNAPGDRTIPAAALFSIHNPSLISNRPIILQHKNSSFFLSNHQPLPPTASFPPTISRRRPLLNIKSAFFQYKSSIFQYEIIILSV